MESLFVLPTLNIETRTGRRWIRDRGRNGLHPWRLVLQQDRDLRND